MSLIPDDIHAYAEAHTHRPSPLLQEIDAYTHAEIPLPQMLSGTLQGRLLAAISHMLCPQRVLEIGTYTGYSALCLAEGLAQHGTLFTLDNNKNLEQAVRQFFAQTPLGKKIQYLIGDAKTLLPNIEGPLDLVFIDADKQGYSHYFDLVIDKVRPGGFIVADNVLWSAKVLPSYPDKDKDTQALIAFNEKVSAHAQVESLLLPIRDGLMFLRRL